MYNLKHLLLIFLLLTISPRITFASSKNVFDSCNKFNQFSQLRMKNGFKEALQVLTEEATKGDHCAQFTLGFWYQLGDMRDNNAYKNDTLAVYWLEKSAQSGHRGAAMFLANKYASGSNEVPINHKKALYWYKRQIGENWKKICANNHLKLPKSGYVDSLTGPETQEKNACSDIEWQENKLAEEIFFKKINYDPSSPFSNIDKNVALIKKYANLGFSSAELLLGYYYYTNHKCSADLLKSIDYYEKAIKGKADYRLSSSNKSIIYWQIADTCQKLGMANAAIENYKNAARYGNLNSIYALSVAYKQGIGIPVNNMKSYIWSGLYKALGYPPP